MGWLDSLIKKVQSEIGKISSARGSVNEIALGAAIGSFFGVFPTFGIGIIIVLSLYKFIRFNIVAATSGSMISNPLTSPFFVLISYQVGKWLTNAKVAFDPGNWTVNFKEVGWVIFLGAIIVSSCVSIAVYFIAGIIVTRWRNSHNSCKNTNRE